MWVTGFVSSQTAVVCGHGFGDHSQDGELARWGLGRDTKWRSSCSKHALEIKLVFGCFYVFDIANTEIHTWKECKNKKE